MGVWGTLAPIATIGASMVNPALGMAVGAGMGALSADERNKELNAKAAKSRNAAAGAIEASWARKDGRGIIPDVFDFNESQSGNMMAGTMGGGMQGYSAGKGFEKDGGFDFFKTKTTTPQNNFINTADSFRPPSGNYAQQPMDFYSYGKKPLMP